jgi:FkbM family methyltransferase
MTLARLRRWRLERRLAAPRLLAVFADENPRATFVEIGSNDGEQHDHLRPFILARDWTGVMVEPVPYVFERLRRNYAGLERVALENAAIADRDGTLPFYHLVDADPETRRTLPSWYDGIGSFSREAVLSHAEHIPDVANRLVEAEVRALTFESLCAKHGIGRVDLLVIDTEGYDWEIVRTLDLARWRPKLLVYEHYHLGPDARAACASHLREHGFATMEEGFDTLCLGPDAGARLRAAFERLTPAVPGVSKHDELA